MRQFMTIEEVSAKVAKNPQLVQQLIETIIETSAFFDDPTAKKEAVVGTQQVVRNAVSEIENIWMA